MKPCLAAPSPFLSGPILSPLIRFALPLMLSQLLQALYGGVELAVVGHFSTSESVVVSFLIQPNSYFSLMFWQG